MLNLEQLQGRVGTGFHPADIGNAFVRASGGLPAHADGDRYVGRVLLAKYIQTEFSQSKFDPLIEVLMQGKDRISPSNTRNQGLNLAYDFTSTAGTYGIGVENFPGDVVTNGCMPCRLPPIDSSSLIANGVVTNKQTIAQIGERRKQLTARYLGKLSPGSADIVPPQNWLILKILSSAEISLSPDTAKSTHKSDKPVIFIQEHFARTLPQLPQFDIDVTGSYLIFETDAGIQLLFLGEEHGKPHYHSYNDGRDRWEQTEFENLSPVHLQQLEDITLPQPTLPRDDFQATNKQTAKLLVLMKFSIWEADKNN